jgi:hypothetical protein
MTRPADTGRVYRAIWRKVKAGFEVETRSRPPLIGAGKTYDGAIEALQVEILSRTGDGEAYVDVQKPPGPSDQVLAPYFKGRMFGVSGNDNAVVTNIDALFTGGLCSSCGNPAGPRTGVTAQLKRAPLAAGAVVVAMRACIYARAFVEALRSTSPANCSARWTRCLSASGRARSHSTNWTSTRPDLPWLFAFPSREATNVRVAATDRFGSAGQAGAASSSTRPWRKSRSWCSGCLVAPARSSFAPICGSA